MGEYETATFCMIGKTREESRSEHFIITPALKRPQEETPQKETEKSKLSTQTYQSVYVLFIAADHWHGLAVFCTLCQQFSLLDSRHTNNNTAPLHGKVYYRGR